ncbi:MAG: OmpA family protein [Nitrospiraceae bacterium]
MRSHLGPASRFFLTLLVLAELPAPHAMGGYTVDPAVESVVRGDQHWAFPAGFIRFSMPSEGVVNQVTGDSQVSGSRMLVGGSHRLYLKLKAGSDTTVGDLLTVYRRQHKVFHPVTGKYLGELIHQLGVIKVVAIEGQFVHGQLVASFSPIGPGDQLTKFVAPTIESRSESDRMAADVQGMIVDFPANRTLVGQLHVVYLDIGRDDGVELGDHLEIYRVGGGLPRRVIGEVKVLALEESTSTVLVTKAIAPLLIGDRIGMRTATTPIPVVEVPEETPSKTSDVQRLAKKIDDLTRMSGGRASMRMEESENRIVLSLDDLANRVHFESGEATIKPDFQPILKQMGEILQQEGAGTKIRIEGHADSQEIGPSLRSKYPTNLELSSARATNVARYLMKEAGIASERLSSVGYGATRPVASNATDQGRRKNRRIEVVLHTPPRSAEALQTPHDPAPPDAKSAGTATLSRVPSPAQTVPNGLSHEPIVDGAPASSPVATAPAESQAAQGSGSLADQSSGGVEPPGSESAPDTVPVDRSEPTESQSDDAAPAPAP